METAFNRTLRFLAEEDAVALTEYAIMLALVVVAAIGAISGVGQKMDGVFTTLDNGINGAGGGS